MSFLASIPGIGAIPGIGLLDGLFDKIDRSVNSSEHNFKKDLHKILDQVIGPEQAEQVQKFLDTGKDEGLGDRLRALMSAGVIPPEMASTIGQLASQDGVPQSSINTHALERPMDDIDTANSMGEEFSKKFGLETSYKQTQSDLQKTLDEDKRLSKNHPRN